MSHVKRNSYNVLQFSVKIIVKYIVSNVIHITYKSLTEKLIGDALKAVIVIDISIFF